MKIKAHVLSVASHGEALKVEAQGSEVGAADWYGLRLLTFSVRDIEANRRTMTVGRELVIEIRPVRR